MPERRSGSSIRKRIVRSTVIIGLAPLVVLGAVVLVSLHRLSGDAGTSVEESRAALGRQVVSASLESTAHNVADDLDTYLLERVHDVQGWAADPLVRAAATEGASQADAQGLPGTGIDELDARYRDQPSLGTSPDSERFLTERIAASGAFAEMFFTDRHGFNVAYSHPTSDFVQSDESWWQGAWANGLDVGAVEYDESARVFSSDIAVRIDSAGGDHLGVLKAVLDLGVIQRIADTHGQGRNITIVDEHGLLLAETATGHDAGRIMRPELVYARTVEPPIARALESVGRTGTASVITGRTALGAAVAGRTQEPVSGFAGFAWTVLVDQPTAEAFAPLSPIGELQRRLDDAATALIVLVALVAAVVGVAALAVALVLARRIVRPILALRDTADELATTRLPELVGSIDRLGAGEELPALDPIDVRTGDEVEDLADKFNSVVATATRLAAEQVELRRRNVSTAFVNMGRRNQNLLGRQLRVLDDLERHETDPDALDGLFRLDHLATRMRRNAESLLVLAGQEPTRTWSRPLAMHDVVRSAVSEIEDYARVDADDVEPAQLRGNVVSEVAHLLAELCENAAAFSPPDTRVEVVGRAGAESYLVLVTDHGIGMTPEQIAAANEKLSAPEGFDRAPSQYLGHFVVGRLALRLGIEVRLFESATGGVVARVTIPASLLDTSEPARSGAVAASRAIPAGAPSPPGASPVLGHAALVVAESPVPEPFGPAGPEAPAERPVATGAGADAPLLPSWARRSGDPAPAPPAEPAGTDGAAGGGAPARLTASGFRVRERKAPGAPAPVARATGAVPARSADEARATLSSFMGGVDRGRRDTDTTQEDDHE